MKSVWIFTVLFVHGILSGYSQFFQPVGSSPFTNFRHDDFHFSGPDSIWIVNQGGNLYRSVDGGNTWDTLISGGPFYGRSIGFFNHLTGIMGQYGWVTPGSGIDTNALYITHDAGVNWQPVLNYSGPFPRGICGISVVNDTVAVGVGRIEGDAVFFRTTNRGQDFQSQDMSVWSDGLVDCHFFSPDTGLITGRGAFGNSYGTSRATVLYTTNGGMTWQEVFAGAHPARWGWKIDFISRDTGFISLENHYTLTASDTNFFLKTTDGGLSWQLLKVFVGGGMNSRMQGIGFINNLTGYTGEATVRKTVDGGTTWTITNELLNFNRYRSVNDTLKYALGRRLYKYHFQTTQSAPEVEDTQISHLVVSPNPATDHVQASFYLHRKSDLIVSIYDMVGIRVWQLEIRSIKSGNHELSLPLMNQPAGLYFIVVSAGNAAVSATTVKR